MRSRLSPLLPLPARTITIRDHNSIRSITRPHRVPARRAKHQDTQIDPVIYSSTLSLPAPTYLFITPRKGISNPSDYASRFLRTPSPVHTLFFLLRFAGPRPPLGRREPPSLSLASQLSMAREARVSFALIARRARNDEVARRSLFVIRS